MPKERVIQFGEGGFLKEYVLKYAELWELPEGFTKWINEECDFCNSLVDRIVTGYPRDEAEELWKEGIWCETYRERYSSLYLNVQESVTILYVILASVALLAAYFSTDIVHVYLSRDYRDIAALSILGMEKKRIKRIYLILSLRAVMTASVIGTIIGLALGSFSPLIIKAVSSSNPSLVEYYISSFSIKIPFFAIAVMILSMALLSLLTLYISIRKAKDLGEAAYEA